MKQKKIFLIVLLYLFFIPFVVNAEECDITKITITNLQQKSIEGNTEEVEEPTFKDRKININLKMFEVGDSITYDMIIKNDSEEDYMIDEDTFKTDSDYIKYTLKTNDNSNIVKAKSSKDVSLIVEYKNEVDSSLLTNNKFDASNSLKLSLNTSEKEGPLEVITTDNIKESVAPSEKESKLEVITTDNIEESVSPQIIKNPLTSAKSIKLIIVVLLTTITIIYLTIHNKKKYNKYILLLLSILVIHTVYAICECDIEIESSIEIEQPIRCISFATDDWSVISYNIKNGNDACYHVGDTRIIELENKGEQEIRLVNKSTPSECQTPGFSQTACGYVIEFVNALGKSAMKMNYSVNSAAKCDGNTCGWSDCFLRKTLNNYTINYLPEELKNIVLDTYVVSGHGNIVSSKVETDENQNFITNDKMYALSIHEVWSDGFEYDTSADYTRQLDYYSSINASSTNYNALIKMNNGSVSPWWMRSAYAGYSDSFFNITTEGNYSHYSSMSNLGYSPVFRIG